MSTLPMDQATADEMVGRAVTYCADKKFSGDTEQTLTALRRGRCDICTMLSECLVQQVSEYLGRMDRMVKAVYRLEQENFVLKEEGGFKSTTGSRAGINLVSLVHRKTPALTALGNTLESALTESRKKIGCQSASPACYMMEVQLVDDRDVQERRGYGVVVDSAYLHATQVWSRPEEIVAGEIGKTRSPDLDDSFNPELAPESLLFQQALMIEQMPEKDRAIWEHRLRELKVVIIRKLISDQLDYINIARDWFSIADLEKIWQRRIGLGKIGGKAAGMLLAARILNEMGDESLRRSLRVPESYFLGSDVVYIFMAMNGLMHWNDQKYKPEEQIHTEYPQIQEQFRAGVFPPEILKELRVILDRVGPKPLVVRSSSQLEDNFGTSFAGKYNSYFCPNQGTPQENLQALTTAITRTYASTFNPNALLYRRSKKLQDYDERMAVLIQEVEGNQYEHYFLPHAAGVAFSHNLYRWDPQIRREDGFVRLVWGLGTRAVDRVGNDFPRLVALSHPLLQPDDSCEAIRHYSQHFVDLIDLEANLLTTMPIGKVLKSNYLPLRHLVQVEQDGYFSTPPRRIFEEEMPRVALTFDTLLRKTKFPAVLSGILRLLEEHYHTPVDMEFTVEIPNPDSAPSEIKVSLLQCRPQSRLQETKNIPIPKDLPAEKIVFSSSFLVPQGYLPNIRFVIFVVPEAYYALPTEKARNEIGRIVGRLNSILAEKSFICVGPGRWGTENIDLGVYVGYSDICNAGALVELAGMGVGVAPEASLGTHFFQDLMEAQIFPVAVPLNQKGTIFNREFFYNTSNKIQGLLDITDELAHCLRLIDVSSYRRGYHLELVMDGEKGEAIAFISQNV